MSNAISKIYIFTIIIHSAKKKKKKKKKCSVSMLRAWVAGAFVDS